MPLVRFGVNNEYKLGVKELYKDGVLNEDPKAVLDGVAVAGIVGVLRQLGDLAQFAAEVFHGLQEQVASTSSRSRKLVNRVQRIEASLPSLEKAILSQTDHLRFAYTPGSEMHACIRIERNHFICDDLPHFVMDSYEECKEPPRLQLLDRFDSGGPGSCLKRYSDPTFFKRASCSSEVSNSEKSQQERKARKIKKRRSSQRSGQFPKSATIFNDSGRTQSSSTGHRQSSLSHTGSNGDMTFKSDMGDQSDSRGSKDGVDLIDSVSRPSISSAQPEIKNMRLSSSVTEAEINVNGSMYHGEKTATVIDDTPCIDVAEATLPRTSNATWDERLELYEPMDGNYVTEDIQQMPLTNSIPRELEFEFVYEKGVNKKNDLFESGSSPKSEADEWHLNSSGDNIMKPTRLNNGGVGVQDDLKANFDLQEHHLEPHVLNSCTQMMDLSEGGKPPHPSTNDNSTNDPAYNRVKTGEAQYILGTNTDVAEKELDTVDSGDSPAYACTDGSNIRSIVWEQLELEAINAEHVSRVDEFCEEVSNEKVIEWNEQDLEILVPEKVSQEHDFSDGENNLKAIEWRQLGLERYKAGPVDQIYTSSEVGNNMQLIEGKTQELETRSDENVCQVDTITEDRNAVQVIEWNELDDCDSGNENFVDALYTMDSESESDFESELKKEVPTIASRDDLRENIANVQKGEILSHLEPEHQGLNTSYERSVERKLENFERSTSTVSSAGMLSADHAQSSIDQSESVTAQELIVSMCLADEPSVGTSHSANMINDAQLHDACVNDPVIRVDQAVSEITRSDPDAPDGNISASNVSQESSVGSSTFYPVISVAPAVSEITRSSSEAPGGKKSICPSNVSQESSVDSSTTYPVCVEPAVSENARSGPEAPASEKIVCAPHVPQETSVGLPTTYPVVSVEPAVSVNARSGSEAPASENIICAPQVPQETSVGSSTTYPVVSVEPAVSVNAQSGSEAPSSEKIICAPHVPQETSVGSSAFWTNGTLFGLAPSKPVVYSMPNSVESAPTSNNENFGQWSHDTMPKVDRLTRAWAASISEADQCNKSDNFGEYVGSSNHLFEQRLGKTPDTSLGYDKSNSSDHRAIRDLINGDAMVLNHKVPAGNSVKSVSSDATCASEDQSSLLSVLSRSLLKNGLRRSGSLGYDESRSPSKSNEFHINRHDAVSHAFPETNLIGKVKNGLRRSGSLGYDERHESSSPSKSSEFDNRCHDAGSHPVPETNIIKKLDSPVNSPPPSPPLEHMKISFQPVDGFDASRLKLKYPEGIDQYENTLDAFPSFQLVPEATKLQHDIVSDSDNDTFSRSYACMSDVSQSHQSDSDSEQWESGDSSESNDHTLYNGLHRISSADSASTSPQHEETDHISIHNGSRSVSNSQALSDPSFQIPNVDAKNSFSSQEMNLSLNPGVDSSHLSESIDEPLPPPLPLPPLQWRVSRPLFEDVENKQDQGSDSMSETFVPKHSGSLIAHPTKVDSAKLINTTQEFATIAKPKESATIARPEESATIAKPNESATIARPKESATIAKPKESATIAKPKESATIAKPKESVIIATPKKVEEQRQEQAYYGEKERKMDDGGDFLHQIRTKSFNLKRTEPTRPTYAPTPATNFKLTAILQKASAIRQAVGSDDGEDDSWSDT